MAAVLSDDAVSVLIDALRPHAIDRERNNARAALKEVAYIVLDEIDLYRIIKSSGARKRIDIARAVRAALLGEVQ